MNNNIYSQVFNAFNANQASLAAPAYQSYAPNYNAQQSYADPYGGGIDYQALAREREREVAMNRTNDAIGLIINQLDSIKGDLLNGYNDVLSRINDAGSGIYQNNDEIRKLVNSS